MTNKLVQKTTKLLRPVSKEKPLIRIFEECSTAEINTIAFFSKQFTTLKQSCKSVNDVQS